MRIQEDGSYVLDDGRVIPADEIAKLHRDASRRVESAPAQTSKQTLAEGETSGPIRLED